MISDDDSQPIPDKISSPSSSSGISSSVLPPSISSFENMAVSTSVSAVSTPAPSISPIASEMNDEILPRSNEVPVLLDKAAGKENVPTAIFTTVKQELLNISGSENLFQKVSLEETPSLTSSISAESGKLVFEFNKANGVPNTESTVPEDLTAEQISKFTSEEVNTNYIASGLVSKQLSLAIKTPALFNTMSTTQSTSYLCKDNKKQFNSEDITPLVQTSLLSSLKRLKLNEDTSDCDVRTESTLNTPEVTVSKILLYPEISNSTLSGNITDVCKKGDTNSTDLPGPDLPQINDNTNLLIISATTEIEDHEKKSNNEQIAVTSSNELHTIPPPIQKLISSSVSILNQEGIAEHNSFDSNVEVSASEETEALAPSLSTGVSIRFPSSRDKDFEPIEDVVRLQESANEKLPESSSNSTPALSSSQSEVSVTTNKSESQSLVLSNISSTSLRNTSTNKSTPLEDTISIERDMSIPSPILMNINSKSIEESGNLSSSDVGDNLLGDKTTETAREDALSINTFCTIANETVIDTVTSNSVSKYKDSHFTEVVSTISVKPISSITHHTTAPNQKPKIESFFIHQVSEEVVNTVKLPKRTSPDRSKPLHKNGLLHTEDVLNSRNYQSNHSAKYLSECAICRLSCCKQDGSCKRQQTKVNSDSVYKFGIATPPAESRYDEQTDLEDSNLSTEDNLIYPGIIRQNEESDEVSDDRLTEGIIYNESAQEDAVSTSELDIKETIVQILPPTANTLATPTTLAALGFESHDNNEQNYTVNADDVESNKTSLETEYRPKYNGINNILKKESSDHRKQKKSKRSSKNKKKKSETEYSSEKHSKPQKVLFTSKAIKWDNYSKVDSDNELDSVLSGPVSDINNQFYENSDVNFNLFGYANSIPPVLLASAEKSKEIESPAFTGMDSDDFRNFIQNEFPFNGVFKFNDRFNSYSRTTNSDHEPVSSKCGVTFNDVVDTRFIEPSYSESEEETEKYTVVVRDGIKCFLDTKLKDDKKLKAIPKLIVNKISDNDLVNKYKVVNHNTLKTCIRKKIDCTLGANCTAVMTNDTLTKGTVECKGCIYIEVLREDIFIPATNNETCITPQDTFPDSNLEFSNSPKFLPSSEELQQCVDKTLDSDNLPTINMLHDVALLSDNSNCYDLKLPTEFSINQNIQTHSVPVNSSTPLFTNTNSNLEREKNILSAEFTVDQVAETQCTTDSSNNLLFINVTSNLEQEKNDIDVVGLDDGLDVILFKTDGSKEKIDTKNEPTILATINPVQCNYANPNDYANNGFLADFAIKTKSGLSPTINASETDTFNYLPDDLYSYFLTEKDSTKVESLNQDQGVILPDHVLESKANQTQPISVSETKSGIDGSFAPEQYINSTLVPPVNFNTHSSVQLLNECNKLHERKTDDKSTTNKVSQKRNSDWLDTAKFTDSEIKVVDANSEFSEKVTIDNPLLIQHNIGLLTEEEIRKFYTPIDMKDLIATLQIGGQTKLPFKKRRVSVNVKNEVKYDPNKEQISYPATPMISIAEVEELQHKVNGSRPFKTPAERKEMPPLPSVYYNANPEPSPIITDQFNINNHTYNNPTINYHMSNVPMPFIPCGPYFPIPPIILPFNNLPPFDSNNPNNLSCNKPTGPPQPFKPEKKKHSRSSKHR